MFHAVLCQGGGVMDFPIPFRFVLFHVPITCCTFVANAAYCNRFDMDNPNPNLGGPSESTSGRFRDMLDRDLDAMPIHQGRGVLVHER